MAVRYPLVRSGSIIAELSSGDSIASLSKTIPVINRVGSLVKVLLENGPNIPVIKRDSSIVNVILEV